MLTRDQIEKAEMMLPYQDVEVPEWGGTVRVRTMTGEERDAFEAEVYEVVGDKIVPKRENYMAKLLVRTIVDENGKRLFGDKEVALLGRKSAKALRRVFNVAQDVNGISKEEQDNIEKK